MDTNEYEEVYKHKDISDKIAIVGELEHLRRHAIRSSVVNDDDDAAFSYAVLSVQCRDMRREFMRKEFDGIKDVDWCACKSAACLRQLVYECKAHDTGFVKAVDNIVDAIWGQALGVDLSDCEACRSDRGVEQ